MKLAFIADIHGNLTALEAVTRELDRLQPDHVILDGDLINACPFSSEVIDFVRANNWLVVRGNHEFYYLDFGTDRADASTQDPERWGALHWLAEQITPQQGDYLASLPDELALYFADTQPIRVAHGVPGRNRVGFYTEQPAEEIVSHIEHVQQATLVSAHTHVQIDRQVSGHVPAEDHSDDFSLNQPAIHAQANGAATWRRWHVINPGSVGLPLNGDPRAQFVLLESVPDVAESANGTHGGWRVDFQRVAYDRAPVLDAFTSTGLLAAGGIISQLFYWELVTAEPEIIKFFHWANTHGHDTQSAFAASFQAYLDATARDQYIRERDPLTVAKQI